MNTIKSLLAASILVAAGAANAATVATFSVDLTGNVNSPPAAGTLNSTTPGTAVLDLTGGVATLTIDTNVTTNLVLFGAPNTTAQDTHTVFSGTLSGSSFSWTSGNSTLSNCSAVSGAAAAFICSQLPVGAIPTTMDQNPIAFNLSNIGAVTLTTANAADPTNVSHYTFTATSVPAAVPVPAAAWLFGSGLLGLATTARRRRS